MYIKSLGVNQTTTTGTQKSTRDESLFLTVPEIYSQNTASVVSIYAKGENTSGIGSGFIISEDGYIATVSHVVAGMTEITVIFNDGEGFPATVVGANDFCDLALLKIERTGLAPVAIGKSSELSIGEQVVAIGTPVSLDYSNSLSYGVVSYDLRDLYIRSNNVLEKKMRLIQVDATLNPGNSGCPLFDGTGNAVGIVTMKLSNYDSICFAIPIDAAMRIFEAMKTGEALSDELVASVSRKPARLGIKAGEGEGGVIIHKIEENASDDIKKSLKAGDIITAVNDTAVNDINILRRIIERLEPGDEITITVSRNGQSLTIPLILTN